MSVTRAVKALLLEAARAMHYAGNLLRERAKAERYDAKRVRYREKEYRRIDRETREDPPAKHEDPKVPGVIEPGSPEFFERIANEMANATKIGGVNVDDLPNGPPADPGPIGP